MASSVVTGSQIVSEICDINGESHAQSMPESRLFLLVLKVA